MLVVIYVEGSFDRIETCATLDNARGFRDGFVDGADMFAGCVTAYVIPVDNAEMEREESASEITRARTAINQLRSA